MNQDKVKRLEDIFRKNNNQGIAIAITGSWGVGKTFFWNKFLDSQWLCCRKLFLKASLAI